MLNGMTGGENSRDTSSFSPSAPSGHLPHQREAFALTNNPINPNSLLEQIVKACELITHFFPFC